MPVLWLAAYPNGARRVWEHHPNEVQRPRCQIGKVGWLENRLNDCGDVGRSICESLPKAGHTFSMAAQRVRNVVDVWGLVEVGAGQAISDILTLHTVEEGLLFDYWRWHDNLCSLKVVRSAWFDQPQPVYTNGQGKAVRLTSGLLFFGADLSGIQFDSGLLLQQVLTAWGVDGPGDIAGIFAPEPLVFLCKHGRWSTLVIDGSKRVSGCNTRVYQLLGRPCSVDGFHALCRAAADAHPRRPGLTPDISAVCRISDRLRRWQQDILDGDPQRLMQLRDSVQLLDTLAERTGGVKAPRAAWKHNSHKFVACMRLMMEIRNRNNLATVVCRSLAIAIPGLDKQVKAQELVDVPHAATMSRYQCALDAAMLVVMAQVLLLPHLLYILADSSPQLGYNFFLSEMMLIAEDSIVKCCMALNELISLAFRFDDDRDTNQLLRRRSELGEELVGYISWVTNTPACLGAGATGLATKVRLILHCLWMMATPPRLPSLLGFLDRVVSFTTDMGTEIGMSDFEAPSVRSLMCPWMFPAQHGMRVLPADDGCEDPDVPHGCDPETEKRHVFPRSLVVPGMLHIFHNLSWKMDESMKYFAEWLVGLKAVITLLHYKQNRDVFAERCVRGTVFDTPRSSLNSGLPSAAEWRWSSIVLVLKALLPLRALLMCCFDRHKMNSAQGADEAADAGDQVEGAEVGPVRSKEGKLDVFLIQKTIRSEKWWAFSEMLWALHGILMAFQGWLEGCDCHACFAAMDPDELKSLSELQKDAGVGGEFDGSLFACPGVGLRAPELASGAWKRIMEALFNTGLSKLLEAITTHVRDCLGDIIADFEKGKECVFAVLELKLQPWTVVPWICAGLGHPDQTVAKTVAVKVLELWAKLTPDEAQRQHRITLIFCLPGEVFNQLREFATQDVDIWSLAALALEVAKLRMIPVVERSIEAKHAIAHLKGVFRRVSPAYVSLHLKMPVLERGIKRKAALLDEVVAAFSSARKVRKLSGHLGLDRHPTLGPMIADRSTPSHLLWKETACVIYSMDPESKFAVFDKAAEANKKSKDAGAARRRKATGYGIPRLCTLTNIFSLAQLDHFRRTVCAGKVYSVPLSALTSQQRGGFKIQPLRQKLDADDGAAFDIVPALAASRAGLQTGRGDDEDDEDDDGDAEAEEIIVFSVIDSTPSKARVIPLPPGTARRLGPDDIQIVIHSDCPSLRRSLKF